MGLAGRKQKQRIPADPRNLSWADDASRFGLSYLSKFGWDASQGLGSSGDGIKSHLKVQQKLDMMGIGAQHQRDPNGIAWKQNKEFEALLKRLNEGAEQVDEEKSALDKAFACAQEEEESSDATKKRKQDDIEITDKKKKRQKSSPDTTAELPVKPRPMAHRARIRAAKRIADKSAAAISEILGIAPSSSLSSSTSTSAPTTPSASDSQPSFSLDKLTTSTKSVADYFKEKLLARSSTSSSLVSSLVPSGSATPGPGAPELGSEPNISLPDEYDSPRIGLGSRTFFSLPPLQVLDGKVAHSSGDSSDMLTENQRKEAARKAEKRKERKIEDSQETEGALDLTKDQTIDDDPKTVQETSKEQKRHKRKQRTPAGGPKTIAETREEGDVARDPLQKPLKKSKKEHKKKRS